MPQDKELFHIDWEDLFSCSSIVLVGDPLSGILSVYEHIQKHYPKIHIQMVHDRTAVADFVNAEVILEIIETIQGTEVERVIIIQKWHGHVVPVTIIPFLIKPEKIEPDTKDRVI
jgi:hypothetical protein